MFWNYLGTMYLGHWNRVYETAFFFKNSPRDSDAHQVRESLNLMISKSFLALTISNLF